jgi:hypothetical protein
MDRRFIELCLDEDVDVLVADLIRARGFDVITTREAAQLHATDEQQLAHSVSQRRANGEPTESQRRAFLTHNRADFELLHQQYLAEGRHHDGIIATRHTPYEIVRRLLLILNDVTADEMRDQLRYI